MNQTSSENISSESGQLEAEPGGALLKLVDGLWLVERPRPVGTKGDKHGMYGTKVYTAWLNMFKRCYYKKHESFQYYGGRGIRVCARWLSCILFVEDMGHPAPELTLERKNVNGHYEPANCIWASRAIQAGNRRNSSKSRSATFRGETKSVSEWSRITGIERTVLYHRLFTMNWDIEKAFGVPTRKCRKRHTLDSVWNQTKHN